MRKLVGIPTAILALALVGCGANDDSETTVPTATATATKTMAEDMKDGMKSDEMKDDKSKEMKPGAYLTKADYEQKMSARSGTEVVYFFHAPWCPDCKATEESLNTAGVPAGLTVVKVDYDSETELKQKYGVTVQHTFVHVDDKGMAIEKFSGKMTGAEIKAEIS